MKTYHYSKGDRLHAVRDRVPYRPRAHPGRAAKVAGQPGSPGGGCRPPSRHREAVVKQALQEAARSAGRTGRPGLRPED